MAMKGSVWIDLGGSFGCVSTIIMSCHGGVRSIQHMRLKRQTRLLHAITDAMSLKQCCSCCCSPPRDLTAAHCFTHFPSLNSSWSSSSPASSSPCSCTFNSLLALSVYTTQPACPERTALWLSRIAGSPRLMLCERGQRDAH